MPTKYDKAFPYLIALALLVRSSVAMAAGPVTGVIRDASGTAMPGMTLQLLNSQQAVLASAKADSQGKFRLADVNPGDYVLLMTRLGQVERND